MVVNDDGATSLLGLRPQHQRHLYCRSIPPADKVKVIKPYKTVGGLGRLTMKSSYASILDAGGERPSRVALKERIHLGGGSRGGGSSVSFHLPSKDCARPASRRRCSAVTTSLRETFRRRRQFADGPSVFRRISAARASSSGRSSTDGLDLGWAPFAFARRRGDWLSRPGEVGPAMVRAAKAMCSGCQRAMTNAAARAVVGS